MTDALLPATVQSALHSVAGERVILDADLARFFGVETAKLNQAVARNLAKFEGYAFMIPIAELPDLMSQDGTSRQHGGRRKPARAFT